FPHAHANDVEGCHDPASAWARSHFVSSGGPLGNTVPVASQLLLSLGTGPDAVLPIEGRSASDLLFRDVRVIALKLSVIGQHLPRERQMMDADPQEAAKRHIH